MHISYSIILRISIPLKELKLKLALETELFFFCFPFFFANKTRLCRIKKETKKSHCALNAGFQEWYFKRFSNSNRSVHCWIKLPFNSVYIFAAQPFGFPLLHRSRCDRIVKLGSIDFHFSSASTPVTSLRFQLASTYPNWLIRYKLSISTRFHVHCDSSTYIKWVRQRR